MRRNRRQKVTRTFQISGISLLLLDVVLYFGMFRPTQALVSSEDQQFAALRRRIFDEEVRIERLTKFRATLPETGKKLAALEREHTPPRRQAFSQAKGLVRRVAEQSGTQLASVAYKLDNNTSGPLQRLGLVINVEGPFPAMMKFAHGLETANELVMIRNFNLVLGDNGMLGLRLVADLYLTP